MDDIQGFASKSYEIAQKVPELTIAQHANIIFVVVPGILVKTVICIVVSLFYILRSLFYLIVPKPLKDIRGQLAVVTGGSNGIGREICLELARCGCNVAILDVDLDAAHRVCNELRAIGVEANAYKVDVGDYNALQVVKKQVNADMGTVQILVNNAGLMPKASIRDGKPDDIRRVMEVNVLAHFWTTQIFIEDMIRQHYGYIVAVSSMIAFYAASQAVTYTTSKYSVKGFMDALNQETRHENWGVKTVTVFPHMTNTRKELMDYLREKVGPTTLQRVGLQHPSRVGKATVYGIRSGSRYVTVPWYYLVIGKFFESLPCEVQDLFDDLIMPRITAKTNHMANGQSNGQSNGKSNGQSNGQSNGTHHNGKAH